MSELIDTTVQAKPSLRPRLLFATWIALSLVVLWRPLAALIHHSLQNDNASHVVLIPFITLWLLFFDRKHIFARTSFDLPAAGAVLVVAAAVSGWAFLSSASWTLNDRVTVQTLALVLTWIAGFVLVWGRLAALAAWYPLSFLLLTVPLPDFVLYRTIHFLQVGSANVAGTVFEWTGVPVLREGFVFHLSQVNVEVASECSGIRSSLALLILAILVAHFTFQTFWKKVVFIVSGIFIMIVKNGIRIVVLTLLANYVDKSFLYGRLHQEGGVVFFLLGLLLLVPLYMLLRRGEKQPSDEVLA